MKNIDQNSWPIGLGIFIAGVAVVFQSLMIGWSVDALVFQVFERDDAFYYFQLSRNIALEGMASFDGIHATNGIQLLWGLILIPLTWMAGDEILYLRVVLALCLFLNALIVAQFFFLGRKMHSTVAGDIFALLWAAILLEKWNSFEGMEFSLHISIALALLNTSWPILSGNRLARIRDLLLVGALLTANYWVRLDSVIYSVVIWIWVFSLICKYKNGKIELLAALTIFPALGAVGYVVTCFVMADTFLPISGIAKTVYANRFFDNFSDSSMLHLQMFWWSKIQFQAFHSLIPDFIRYLWEPDYPLKSPTNLRSIAIFTLVSLIGFWAIWRDGSGRRTLPLLAVVFAASIVHVWVTIMVIGDFAHVSRHYYGWLVIFWLLFGGLALATMVKIVPFRSIFVAPAVFAIFSLVYWPSARQYILPNSPNTEDYSISRMVLAARLNKLLPEDAVVGAWNAGILAYFLDRPVVSLDGLMNDADFAMFLEAERPLLPYLHNQGIGYLIDHDRRDLTARFGEERGKPGSDFRNMVAWSSLEEIDREGVSARSWTTMAVTSSRGSSAPT